MKAFICRNCGKSVSLSAPGTKNRNHCPFCLFSQHVDARTGDRSSSCRGLMMPIGKYLKKDGEEVIVHKCQECGFVRANRVAGDDSYYLVDTLPIVEQESINNL